MHELTAVQVHEGGCVSPFLRDLPLGGTARFARTLTKHLAAPFDGPGAAGHSLALIGFGIGAAELPLTAARAAAAGQRVQVDLAVATGNDVVLLTEFFSAATAAAMATGTGAGSLAVAVLVSREQPSAELTACVAAAVASGAVVTAMKARVDSTSIGQLLPATPWAVGPAAALCVGTRAQTREGYHLLAEVGITQRLLGRPILF